MRPSNPCPHSKQLRSICLSNKQCHNTHRSSKYRRSLRLHKHRLNNSFLPGDQGMFVKLPLVVACENKAFVGFGEHERASV